MRRSMMMALSLALMVPAVGVAQRPDGPRMRDGREMPMRPPAGGVALMLEKKADLKLTDDQVTRLEAIQARYAERTAPLRARADSLRPDRGERQDLDANALRQRRQAGAEIMTLMREEGQTARTEALALLSNDQQQKVQEMEQSRRKEMEARRDRRGDGPGGRRSGGGGRRGGGGGPPGR
jgi:Spy/CpxP family protein refolding chaperone